MKKFYWNHIYDHRVNIQHVPMLRLHSAYIQPVPLKMMMIRLGPDPHTKRPQKSQWTLPLSSAECSAHTHIQGTQEERMTVWHHTSMRVLCHLKEFSCCISEIVTLLVVETNRCNHWCMDSLDKGPSPQPDVTETEMSVFLAITVQMGHCLRPTDTLLCRNVQVLQSILQQHDDTKQIFTHT